MELLGVVKGDQYFPAKGFYQGMPYQIRQKGSQFLLEVTKLAFGLGQISYPIGWLDETWVGCFLEEILDMEIR